MPVRPRMYSLFQMQTGRWIRVMPSYFTHRKAQIIFRPLIEGAKLSRDTAPLKVCRALKGETIVPLC